MTEIDATKDFRYRLGDIEIEGYQLTPKTLWLTQHWPEWLKMQRLPDETNRLYRTADNPQSLTLSLPTGDVEVPPLGWIVKHSDGHMGIMDPLDMELYEKVVPIPPPVVHPPADGIADGATVTPIAPNAALDNVVGDINEMRNEMMSAIKLLQEGDHEGALDYLIMSMSKRTKWCDCPPGICSQADEAGCRINSPLVKT